MPLSIEHTERLQTAIVTGRKQCTRCGIEKGLDQFSIDQAHSTGRKSACKQCAGQDHKKWRSENLEYIRRADRIKHYVRKYQLNESQAEVLVENRIFQCGICKTITHLVVDHCHNTGKVRGLICSSCNSAIDYAKENVETLKKMIEYIEKHR